MTKTEELREKIAKRFCECLVGDDWLHSSPGQIMFYRTFADRVLEYCSDAGLAFVVTDAELPENPYNPNKRGFIAQYSAYLDAQQDMLNVRFRQTEKIGTREPR